MKINKFVIRSEEITHNARELKVMQNIKNKFKKKQKAQNRVNTYFPQNGKLAQTASSFFQITLEK